MPNEKPEKKQRPAQRQKRQPGWQHKMKPQPESGERFYRSAAKLTNKVALITGGDSGIGRAVALLFAKESADCAIVYLNEHRDAQRDATPCRTRRKKMRVDCRPRRQRKILQTRGRPNDERVRPPRHPGKQRRRTASQESLAKITEKQLLRTFRTNIFAMFFLTKAALPRLKKGAAIINTASVTTYKGSPKLLDYSATKGAIVGFTRSLSQSLVEKGIRVNAVAPGPIWTPLIPATFPAKEVATFGADVAMKRAGQPEEVATCFVFLASDDSSYMTGQVLHPNGGTIVNS